MSIDGSAAEKPAAPQDSDKAAAPEDGAATPTNKPATATSDVKNRPKDTWFLSDFDILELSTLWMFDKHFD